MNPFQNIVNKVVDRVCKSCGRPPRRGEQSGCSDCELPEDGRRPEEEEPDPPKRERYRPGKKS